MPNFDDSDDDGIDTADENDDGYQDPSDEDSDGDGVPDNLDPDDDADGIPSAQECPDALAGCEDSDGDGRPDYLDVCGDDRVSAIDPSSSWEECDDGNAVDGDGCDSSCRRETGVPDSDGDGIDTADEISASNELGNEDSGGDGDANWLDADSVGDGIADGDEAGDSNGNGILDYLDRNDGAFEEGRFSISGGRGVGCHVGVMRDQAPTAVLLLMMLVFGLGIRRYRRN